MKTILLSLSLITLLSGCVIAPARHAPAVQAQVIVPVEVVEYPQYESAYIWDPATVSFYFTYSNKRYYMDRGWHPVYGYPRGGYKRR